MKRTASWIVLSLAANVLLAGWWLKARTVSKPVETPVEARLSNTTEEPIIAPVASVVPAVNRPQSDPVAAAQTASWLALQTDDLKEFVRRLRAAGCPEETVQDIIMAEVNRDYGARSRELWPDRANKPFWEVEKSDPAENKKNRDRSRKSRELQKEKAALLVELLGVNPEKERRKADGWPDYGDYYERRYSFLPEAKRESVSKVLDDFDDKMQEFYARNRGMYDSQYRTEQKQLEAERMQALAQHLTPEELREYELRQSQMANQLRHDLRSLTVTREEYEAIYDVRKKYGDGIYNYSDIETKEARDQVTRNKEALEVDLATALGTEKARDYKRSQDYTYQELDRFARRNDLPVDTAGKVYDFKEAAEGSAKQINANADLTPEQRQQALAEIRDATQQAVKAALGDHFNTYLRRGGWWINNISPAPRPPR